MFSLSFSITSISPLIVGVKHFFPLLVIFYCFYSTLGVLYIWVYKEGKLQNGI
nr:MAG TPA: hypothetical protein [Caudoviricetes sp.]DAX94232.1 MAG TPA: hypothetical protein [Caudoviricetes sp.]